MPNMPFSLLTAFGVVTFFAVSFAAMARPSSLWASIVWTATMVTLGSALLGCIFGSKRWRAYYAGFSFFGIAHMTLLFGPWFRDHTADVLVTSHIADYIALSLDQRKLSGFQRVTYPAFIVIVQSILTVVVALLGGLIGRFISRPQSGEGPE